MNPISFTSYFTVYERLYKWVLDEVKRYIHEKIFKKDLRNYEWGPDLTPQCRQLEGRLSSLLPHNRMRRRCALPVTFGQNLNSLFHLIYDPKGWDRYRLDLKGTEIWWRNTDLGLLQVLCSIDGGHECLMFWLDPVPPSPPTLTMRSRKLLHYIFHHINCYITLCWIYRYEYL